MSKALGRRIAARGATHRAGLQTTRTYQQGKGGATKKAAPNEGGGRAWGPVYSLTQWGGGLSGEPAIGD